MKESIVGKFKEVEMGSNLAESCKKGYGSKSAILPMMMKYSELQSFWTLST
jgi:hypothetical protein